MARPANDPADVFLQVDTRDGDETQCWPWQGATSGRDDRGYISVDGKRWLVYRLVYTIAHGDIPEGQVVRHKCDNPLCCNPFHLELGTRSQNEQDKYDRDRAGLPVAAVREIKRLLGTTSLPQRTIAEHVERKFGVACSRESVRNIKLNLRRDQSSARTAEEIIADAAGGIRVDEGDVVDEGTDDSLTE